MTNTGTIVAAMKLRKERSIVGLLRDKGAVSAAGAIAIDKRGGLEGSALRGLLRSGAVIESEPGRYWFSEAAYKRQRSTRTMVMCAAVVGAVVLVAILIWLFR